MGLIFKKDRSLKGTIVFGGVHDIVIWIHKT